MAQVSHVQELQSCVDFLITHASQLSSCSPQSMEELRGILGQVPTAILKTKQAPQPRTFIKILPWTPDIDQRYPGPQQQAGIPRQRSGARSVTQLRSNKAGCTAAVDFVDEPQLQSKKDGHTTAVDLRTKKPKKPQEPVDALIKIEESFIRLDEHRDDFRRFSDRHDIKVEDSIRILIRPTPVDKLRGTIGILLIYEGFLEAKQKIGQWALDHKLAVKVASKLICTGKKLYTLVQVYKETKEDYGIVILLTFIYQWWYNLSFQGIRELAGLFRKHDRIPELATACWSFYDYFQQNHGIEKTNCRKRKWIDGVITAVPELPNFRPLEAVDRVIVAVAPKPPDFQPRKRNRVIEAVISKPQAFQPVSKDHEHQDSPVSVTADDLTSAGATLAPDNEGTRSVASSATDPKSQRSLSGGNATHQRQLEFGLEDGCQVPNVPHFLGNVPIGNEATREMSAPVFAASQEQSSQVVPAQTYEPTQRVPDQFLDVNFLDVNSASGQNTSNAHTKMEPTDIDTIIDGFQAQFSKPNIMDEFQAQFSSPNFNEFQAQFSDPNCIDDFQAEFSHPNCMDEFYPMTL